MIQQLAIGTVLIITTVLVHALATHAVIRFTVRIHTRSHVVPGVWRITWLTAAFVFTMFLAAMLEALIWAWTYIAVGAFDGLEPAFYFSIVAFSTLGFGDVVLDPSWRVLSAVEAANGIMMFGWTTALVFWLMQRLVRASRLLDGLPAGMSDVSSEPD
jgi:hypothetical protein